MKDLGLAWWILDGDEPRQAEWEEYIAWMSNGFDQTRRIARSKVRGVEVSTVFLSVDHQFGSGPPILFETMIFGGDQDQEQWRYTSKAAAVVGHKRVVRALRAGIVP